MDSLTEFKNLLKENQIEIKSFSGYELKVGKDTWLLRHGMFYCNGEAVKHNDKKFFAKYVKDKQNVKHQGTQTRKWRGISSRNYRGK